MRLEYHEDGTVSASVKLQEVFGLAETPRIGPRREPVLLALTAPNGRPVQLTRDLRSFWDRTYPEVRKELRGRYPKHPWPEDPWTAPPTARTTKRSRRIFVRSLKADLVARGVDISGPCGAFQITGRVGYLLRDEGWGLLAKSPGQNGCSINGDRYAVDFLLHNPSRQGVDLLVNSETQNIPAWQLTPQPAYPDLTLWRAPFQMDVVPPPPPPPPPPPHHLPPPPPPHLKVKGTSKAMDMQISPCIAPRQVPRTSRDRAQSSTAGGLSTDVPVPADYDGDGKTDPAVFRIGTREWMIGLSSNGSTVRYAWGLGTDVPVPGDYDGDGKTDLAVFRPSTGTWYILQSSTSYTTYVVQPWGLGTDVPVPGDYDGDGKTDLAVFRPSTSTWYILYSSTGTFAAIPWGTAQDVVAPGDYDGDGKTDLAVFRPSTGTWFIAFSSTGSSAALG